MSSITKIAFFLILSIVLPFAYANRAYTDANHHTTIVLTNKFPTDTTTAECKSKSDDRGVHTVPSGQTYSFDVNFDDADPLYMFFCQIESSSGTGIFDVYNSTRDIPRCPGTCNWDIAANGVSGYPQGSPNPDIVFKW